MARPQAPDADAPRTPRDEQTVYGVKAALALLEHRPQAVRRIFHAPPLRGELGAHLSAAAARHVPYRELDADGLAKVAGTPHHEGLVVVAEPLRWRNLPARPPAGPAEPVWLALDGVENPHNLGAIVRTAAFFGITGLLAGGVNPGEKVNAAVLRVAEGGAEHVPLIGAGALPRALGLLQGTGCRVLALETDGLLPLPDAVADGLATGPLVLVLGREREGLSAAVRGACDALCVLRGAGPLPSLNVSVTAGVALAEVLRGRPAPAQLPAEQPESRRAAGPQRAAGRGLRQAATAERPQGSGDRPERGQPKPRGRRIRGGGK